MRLFQAPLDCLNSPLFASLSSWLALHGYALLMSFMQNFPAQNRAHKLSVFLLGFVVFTPYKI